MRYNKAKGRIKEGGVTRKKANMRYRKRERRKYVEVIYME